MSLAAEGSVLYRARRRVGAVAPRPPSTRWTFLSLLMHIPLPKLHTVRYYG